MSTSLARRTLIQSSAVLAAASLVNSPALAQNTPATGPKPMPYAIKPLPFDPTKIKGFSEKILTSHHDNNYSGAVKRLNAITEQIAGLDYAKAPVFVINGLKREELIAANSMILHEIYFSGLGEESHPGAALADALARDFGSADRWRAEFVAMGKAEGGGSGWVILAWSRSCQRHRQVLLLPVRRMISLVPRPSAVSNTILARHTCF